MMKRLAKEWWILLLLVIFGSGCASKQEIELFHQLDQNRSVGEHRLVATQNVHSRYYVYRFRPFDRLAVTVYGQPELSTPPGGVLIDAKGVASLPMIGAVSVGGLSESQASAKIQALMRKYVVDAVVVAENPDKKVFVIGDVNRPGPVKLSSGQIALLRAIGSAGGFRDTANRDTIYLVRNRNGKATLKRLSLSGEQSLRDAFETLIPGDIVYVAPNSAKIVNIGPMQTLKIIGDALSPFAAMKTITD